MKSAVNRKKRKLTDAPAGRQTMLPKEKQSVARPRASEKASPERWKKVHRRAGELAMNEGTPPREAKEKHLRRAKRELLGLQTLPDPEKP